MNKKFKVVFSLFGILAAYFGVIAYAHQIAPLAGIWNVTAEQEEKPAQKYFASKVATTYLISGFKGNYSMAPANRSHPPTRLFLNPKDGNYVASVNQSVNKADSQGHLIHSISDMFSLHFMRDGKSCKGSLCEQVQFADGKEKAVVYGLEARRNRS